MMRPGGPARLGSPPCRGMKACLPALHLPLRLLHLPTGLLARICFQLPWKTNGKRLPYSFRPPHSGERGRRNGVSGVRLATSGISSSACGAGHMYRGFPWLLLLLLVEGEENYVCPGFSLCHTADGVERCREEASLEEAQAFE